MSRESLASDLQSLERMVTDFTADKYGTSGAELQAVAARVREGDLTQVLKCVRDGDEESCQVDGERIAHSISADPDPESEGGP